MAEPSGRLSNLVLFTFMITLSVYITCKSEKAKEARRFFESFVGKARSEPGCIQYDLYQVEGETSHFYFFEKWKDKPAFEAHSSQDYLVEFKRRYSELLEKPNQVTFLIDIE